jgi:hypothetical protein
MHVSKETSLRFCDTSGLSFFFGLRNWRGWTPTVILLLIYEVDKKSTNTKKLRKKDKENAN